MFSANEILDMAIKIEKNGEAVYRDAIGKVSKPELLLLLEWMADEEAKHADWFSNLKLNLKEKRANPFMEEMSRELFDDLLGDKNFSLKDVDFSSIDKIDDKPVAGPPAKGVGPAQPFFIRAKIVPFCRFCIFTIG